MAPITEFLREEATLCHTLFDIKLFKSIYCRLLSIFNMTVRKASKTVGDSSIPTAICNICQVPTESRVRLLIGTKLFLIR